MTFDMLLIIFTATAAVQTAAVDLTGLEVEQKAVAQRRAIRSAVLTARVTTTMRQDERDVLRQRTVKLWFDGDKRRADILTPDEHATQSRDIRCVANGRHIYWSDRSGAGGGRIVVADHDIRLQKPPPGLAPIDPRMIGMACTSFANLEQFHLETCFLSPDRKATAESPADRVESDGIECLESRYERHNGGRYRLLVAPSMDYCSVRIEAELATEGVSYQGVVDVKNAFHERSQTWFPVEYRYQRINNDQVTDDETVTITVESLNEPVSTEIFTLAGMNLPAGVHVSRYPEDEHLVGVNVWNGQELVHEGDADEAVPAAAPPPGSAKPVILTFFSIILAVIAAAALWRYLSSRTASS